MGLANMLNNIHYASLDPRRATEQDTNIQGGIFQILDLHGLKFRAQLCHTGMPTFSATFEL